jgi:hypothetical protein
MGSWRARTDGLGKGGCLRQEAGCRSRGVKFAPDSPVEGKGFEPSVPRRRPTVVDITPLTASTFFGAVAEDLDEFFNHGASPRASPSVPMTTRGAPPVMLILVDLPPAPWISPGSASRRLHPVAAQRVAP